MPRREVPDEVRAAIEADIREGGTCRGIARAHGVSPAFVSKVAKDAGIEGAFAEKRSQTKRAREARVFDARIARQELLERLYGDAEWFRQRARGSYTVVATGPAGPELITLKQPPMADAAKAMTACGIAIDKAIALERFDADGGAAAGVTMINDLFGRLSSAYYEHVDAAAEAAAAAAMEADELPMRPDSYVGGDAP